VKPKKAAVFSDSGQNTASETPYCWERPSRRKSLCQKERENASPQPFMKKLVAISRKSGSRK